jgi:ATP-binding cassette subfamily B protein
VEEARTSWLQRRREIVRRRVELARVLGAASPRLVAAAVVTAVVTGLLPVALILAGGVLSERIEVAVGGEATDPELYAVYRAFVLVMGLFLIGELLVPLQNRLRWLITKRVDGAVRTRLLRAAMAGTDMSRMHGTEYLDAMRTTSGVIRYQATPGAGSAGMIGLARDYLTGFAAVVVVAAFQPLVAVAALAVGLLMRARWRATVIRIVNVWIEGSRDRREAYYFTDLGLGRTAAHELRLFGLGEWVRDRIRAAGVRAWAPTWRERNVSMRTATSLEIALSGAVAAAGLVWAGLAAADGELSIGGLVAFAPALFAALSLGRSFDDDVPVEYGTWSLPAVETLEQLAADALAVEAGTARPRTDAPPAIALRGVSFRYPEGERDVLTDIDIEIPAGRAAALVGMNGAGKTTLVRLLCGLYPPDRGAVLVDGVDLRALDLVAWHRLIAPMFQESLRVPAIVADNVGTGAVEHLADLPHVREALEEAGAMRFAERLGGGLDTVLATRHGDGTDLSGGQWQRIAVARALFALRQGARFLVLDEPTSNLDTASEERLVRRLLEETRDLATTLLVTHRLSLARRAARIFVVDGGRVVETGSHDELVARSGRYADAFAMQAGLYPYE